MAIRLLSNPRSIERAIADLTEIMEQYDATHPRAIRLAAMIEGLRKFRGEPAGDDVAPSARQAA
jgi:hypothetical protein